MGTTGNDGERRAAANSSGHEVLQLCLPLHNRAFEGHDEGFGLDVIVGRVVLEVLPKCVRKCSSRKVRNTFDISNKEDVHLKEIGTLRLDGGFLLDQLADTHDLVVDVVPELLIVVCLGHDGGGGFFFDDGCLSSRGCILDGLELLRVLQSVCSFFIGNTLGFRRCRGHGRSYQGGEDDCARGTVGDDVDATGVRLQEIDEALPLYKGVVLVLLSLLTIDVLTISAILM